MAETTVTVYSTPTCPWCVRVKGYLQQKGVEFTDVDVSKDIEKAREMVKLSGQMGVPVVAINGSVIVGFDKEKIDELLGL